MIESLKTGLIDAVQVIFNIFDQSPEDELFPVCRERDIAVIARVPFDEGTLTGTLTKTSRWPQGRLAQQLFRAGKPRAERRSRRGPAAAGAARNDDARARPALDFGRADGLLRSSPACARSSTSKQTSRRATASQLDASLLRRLKAHRWDRTPTDWSQ